MCGGALVIETHFRSEGDKCQIKRGNLSTCRGNSGRINEKMSLLRKAQPANMFRRVNIHQSLRELMNMNEAWGLAFLSIAGKTP